MSSLREQLDLGRLPQHIAIIMDGNGRWAKEQGQDRVFGHHEGVLSVREIVNGCAEIGISYLTLYAFSTENWNRPKEEVDALMELLVNTIRKEVEELKKNNVRLHVIGDFESLPAVCQKELNEAKEMTATNTGLNLILALSYSSRWEMIDAAKKMVADAAAGTGHQSHLSVERKQGHERASPPPGEHRSSADAPRCRGWEDAAG